MRLNGLALLYVHRDIGFDFEQVIAEFSLKNRRLNFNFWCCLTSIVLQNIFKAITGISQFGSICCGREIVLGEDVHFYLIRQKNFFTVSRLRITNFVKKETSNFYEREKTCLLFNFIVFSSQFTFCKI